MIRRAELLVFATPVYNLTFPAPLKAIVDRFQRYFEARFALGLRPPIEKPKKAALLMTLGSKDMFGAEVVEKQLRMAFSVMNTQLEEVVAWPGTDRPEGKEQLNAMFEQAHLSALAIKETGIKTIAIGGGVSANSGFRNRVQEFAELHSLKAFIPKRSFTTDNAAMVAVAGHFKYLNKDFCSLDLPPYARVSV